MEYVSGQFAIGGGNNNFITKQNALFQQLNEAERTINTRREQAQIDLICDIPQDDLQCKSTSMKKFRGKESIFKRPDRPIPRHLLSRNKPDFVKNPHKWTKYSLEDISTTDMSESSNASAAFTFLKEMENRRDNEINNIVDATPKYNSSVKVRLGSKSDCNDSETKVLKNLKVMMPEYVVGQSIKKRTAIQKRVTPGVNKKELKLSHLDEFDGEDED